jgi:hypothetical protein
MPEIVIAKTKFRRGSNDERKSVSFDQGEPVFTTDTKRLFIGTGSLSGGIVIGSKIHPPITNFHSLSNTIAEIGDLQFANNKFYQLTAYNSWGDVNLKLNPITFSYDSSNYLNLNQDSISAIYLDSSTISNGIKVDSGLLQLDFQTKSFELSSGKLSIKISGLDEREISSTSFGNGIEGGSGDKISLKVDPSYFIFSGDTLSLSSAPVDITFTDLSSNWFGDGLYYDLGQEEIRAVVTDVDNSTLVKNVSGIASLRVLSVSATSEWSKLTIDNYGRITDVDNSILDVISGNSSLGNLNSLNSLSAIYNGDMLGLSGLNITTFHGLSSDGVTTLVLSSAGFITFEGGSLTRNGSPTGRFAIPIYRY